MCRSTWKITLILSSQEVTNRQNVGVVNSQSSKFLTWDNLTGLIRSPYMLNAVIDSISNLN